MKGLFVVFHGFSEHSGISKKIRSQCEALTHNGVPTELCYLDIAPDGTQRRMVGDRPVRIFGRGVKAKILKRLSFGDITRYIRREGIGMLYIRYDHNASPALNRWLAHLQRLGVRTALEIPTYPYDAEFAHLPLSYRVKHWLERLFRRRMARRIDRIVTFSDDGEIFGRPAIRISNGIDFDRIPLKRLREDPTHEVHLLAVANIHVWHGFDRAIEGLGRYYGTPRERIVRLHIVGDSFRELLDAFRSRIEALGLSRYVTLTGPLSGAELDAEFAWCDMGIASLGRHRNGITHLKSLKNREYAARGIPFVYSETDDDFERMPYVLKAPADDTPLDIEGLLRFYDAQHLAPDAIRATVADSLSWKRQMGTVVRELLRHPTSEP